MTEIIKCSTCHEEMARIEFISPYCDLKIMKFHCNKCNFDIDDITWFEGQKHKESDRAHTFATMEKLNNVNKK